MHFLTDLTCREDESPANWNARVNAFDTVKLARQLHELQAGWLMLTIGQNSGYYCSPNRTLDELTGRTEESHCSRRDLWRNIGFPCLSICRGELRSGTARHVRLWSGANRGTKTRAKSIFSANGSVSFGSGLSAGENPSPAGGSTAVTSTRAVKCMISPMNRISGVSPERCAPGIPILWSAGIPGWRIPNFIRYLPRKITPPGNVRSPDRF